MNPYVYFSISSFVYLIILSFVYFGKKKIKSFENRIYSIILVIILLCLFFEIGSAFIFDSRLLLIKVIAKKIFMCLLLTWGLIFLMYNVSISNGITSFRQFLKKNLFLIPIYIVHVITIIIILVSKLNFKYSSTGMVLNTYGYGQTIFIMTMFLYCFIIFIILLINFKQLQSKKYLPSIIFIVLMIISGIIQTLNPTVLLANFVVSIIVLLMYFTIENPDVKMINELDLAKKNAERANMAKTDFLSSMSHEIRTPLNAIVGFSNSILEDKTLKEAQDEAKDIIMASQNLLEIVNGILDISKIEAGKMEIVNVDYKLVSMCNDIVKLIKPRIGEKPIELKVKYSSDIPAILYGDQGKIKEVITNLLSNACKYTESGIINFEISCINQKDTSKLVISVEDTGRGIKPDKIDKLFTKFNRLDEDKNTTLEGTGLGLAITKSLVDMMGGKIIVQSKYGSGSKFTVYLSQKIISMIDDKVEEKEEQNKELDYSNKKVLIVDDNNLNIKVATRLLKNYNMIPDTVLSGFDCLEKVKDNTYDLILMDDMMPKMSGVETFHKLKEDNNFNIPVVILTANAISGMKEKYLSEGLDDYLAKPIDKLELDRILNEYLNKK